MWKKLIPVGAGIVLVVAAVSFSGCTTSTDSKSNGERKASSDDAQSPEQPVPSTDAADGVSAGGAEGEHGHKEGAHGGIIVSLGRDSYHVEAIVTEGELRLYTLGNDESRVIDIASQELQGFVKAAGSSEARPITITPQPQPGDSEGKASLFVAKLPDDLAGNAIEVTVPNITIDGERFRFNFSTATDSESHAEGANHVGSASVPGAPPKVTSEAERKLYLEPGGLYTLADIEANGSRTGSQKFADFQAAHDLEPQVGDKICPITLTKANPECTWIVGGKEYEFCCPPCVDEFVALAKSNPDEIKSPDEYVKRDAE